MRKNSRDQRIEEKNKATPRYRDPNQSATARTKDLLSRMTLEEKAAQMMCVWQEKANTLVDPKGKFEWLL